MRRRKSVLATGESIRYATILATGVAIGARRDRRTELIAPHTGLYDEIEQTSTAVESAADNSIRLICSYLGVLSVKRFRSSVSHEQLAAVQQRLDTLDYRLTVTFMQFTAGLRLPAQINVEIPIGDLSRKLEVLCDRL